MTIKRRNLLSAMVGVFGISAVSSRSNAKDECRGVRIEVYQSGNNWRWRLYAQNGEQIAEHMQPYHSKQKCLEGIESVKNALRTAKVVMKEECA